MGELAQITNHRAGRCMCGRDEGVQYGPHPMGYGNACIYCQREWERQHGGARWESNDFAMARLRAERARAIADGRDEGEVVTAWNRGLPPFARPPRSDSKLSPEWQAAYDAWWAQLNEGVIP